MTQKINTKKAKTFLSDYQGYSPMDEKGIICRFRRIEIIDEYLKRPKMIGYLITDNDDVIKRLSNHPDVNKGFKEVDSIPRSTTRTSVITGVVTPTAKENAEIVKDTSQLKVQFEGVK